MSGTGVLLSRGAPYLMAPSWASAFGTSGDMYASAHDLLRWGDALYGGRVLSAKGMAHMLDFQRQGTRTTATGWVPSASRSATRPATATPACCAASPR